MIILSLSAENFRRYAYLLLENLPERGLVAVTGGNESGKSTLGDAILFALFGRTERLPGGQAHKLVRWGAQQAEVGVLLEHQGRYYRLARTITVDGATSASLFDVEENTVLADTSETVATHLKTLFGFGYGAFTQAFFWGQQIGQQQADATIVKNMAGVQGHAQLVEQLQRESRLRQQEIETLAGHEAELQSQLEAMQLDEQRLPKLCGMETELEVHQQHFLHVSQWISRDAALYPENHLNFHKALKQLKRWSGLGRLSLLLLFMTALAGLFLVFTPGWGEAWVEQLVGGMRAAWGQALLWVAALAALLASFFLFAGWGVESRRLDPLREFAENLQQALNEGHASALAPASRLLKAATHETLQALHTEPLEALEGVDSKHNLLAPVPGWAQAAGQYAEAPARIADAADILTASMEERSREFGNYARAVRQVKEEEQGHVRRFDRLRTALDEAAAKLEKERREQVVATTASDLLQRSAGNIIGRFNRIVDKRCRDLLSRFTQAHYQSLEITPDFVLKVLSEKKGDFLEFDETSAGTQRQIALAMRVALAEALADSTQTDANLLFLDEPFAFFDPLRAANTLHSLQDASTRRLSQIWLTMQTLPEEMGFAKLIHCPPDTDTLVA